MRESIWMRLRRRFCRMVGHRWFKFDGYVLECRVCGQFTDPFGFRHMYVNPGEVEEYEL